jgi:hypothetical protein
MARGNWLLKQTCCVVRLTFYPTDARLMCLGRRKQCQMSLS